MRWIVISLTLLNLGYLIWNWLEYSHAHDSHYQSSELSSSEVKGVGSHIALLSERSAVLPVSAPGGAPPPVAANQPFPGEVSVEQADLVCMLLGPYQDIALGSVLQSRLLALGIHAKMAAVEIAGDPEYWVYLKPEPTRELAIVKLKELQEKKVDSFIIPDGDIANGISLGVFDNKENAERYRQLIVEQGYDGQVRANPRKYLENWVVIYPEDAGRFSVELYEQLRNENNKLDLRKDNCSKVASITDIQ